MSLRLVLLFTVLLTLAPRAAVACVCYNDAGEDRPVDPQPFCAGLCYPDTATAAGPDDCTFGEPSCSFDSGYCTCPADSSVQPFTCEQVCEDAELSFVALTAPAATTPAEPTTPPKKLITPTLSVEIPGVKFSEGTINGNVISVNYLGDYISGVYKYLLGASTLIAIVMIMISGLEWSFSGGSIMGTDNKASASRAKTRIRNAVTGLVLLLSAYILLYTVNPNLVRLQTPKIKIVNVIELPATGEDDNVIAGATAAPDGTKPPLHKSIVANGQMLNSVAISGFYAAAEEFAAITGDRINVTSGSRTPERQLQIFFDKCGPTSTDANCDPLVCMNHDYQQTGKLTRLGDGKWKINGVDVNSQAAFVADLIDDSKTSLCPHTSSVALDIWCEKGSYGDYTFDTQCMRTLGEVMMRHGFCRLEAEPWHFEYDQYHVSSACSTSQDPCVYKGNATYNFCTDKNAAGETCKKYQAKKAGKCVAY